ncbi:MAG: hypothetical protein ACREH4_10340 [Vitreimonas sp.]
MLSIQGGRLPPKVSFALTMTGFTVCLKARQMIAMISRPLAVISTLGWLLTLGFSVALRAGAHFPAPALDALFFALFLLYGGAILTLLFAMRNTPIISPGRRWGRAIARAPRWAKFSLWGSIAYATIIIVAAPLIFPGQAPGGDGVIVVLFSVPVLIFSTTSISLDCPKGHRVGPFEQYCRACGAPILANEFR